MTEFFAAYSAFSKYYAPQVQQNKAHLTYDQYNKSFVLSFRNEEEMNSAKDAFPSSYEGYEIVRKITYDSSRLVTIARDQFRVEYAAVLERYGCYANTNNIGTFAIRIDNSSARMLRAIARKLPKEYMGFPLQYQQTDFRALSS